ncbi:MAG: stalk domain-containing protein [Clostridia bacterium]|nr:stalk domain-containing protein [Clostridia bacterium]
MKRIFSIVLITALCFISVANASSAKKMLEAWYGAKIIYNNQEIASDVKPFIVNGTTYVPLRLLMSCFNKDISWDSATQKITITDRANTAEIALRNEIAQKNVMIAELQAKVNQLQGLSYRSSGSAAFYDLEDDLNADYGRYNSKNFKITLSGDKDAVSVRVEASLTDWSNLSASGRTTLLKSICDDIKDSFRNAKISGYVKNSSGSGKFLYFYYRSDRVLRTNSASESLLSFEQELTDKYADYLEGDDIESLQITLDGNAYDIEYKINIPYNNYRNEWYYLSDTKIKRLMTRVYNDIEDEFIDAHIFGRFYDTDNSRSLATYAISSSGSESFYRSVR